MAQQVRTCLFLQRIQVCFSELMRSGSKVPMSPVAGQDCVNSWHIDGGKEGLQGQLASTRVTAMQLCGQPLLRWSHGNSDGTGDAMQNEQSQGSGEGSNRTSHVSDNHSRNRHKGQGSEASQVGKMLFSPLSRPGESILLRPTQKLSICHGGTKQPSTQACRRTVMFSGSTCYCSWLSIVVKSDIHCQGQHWKNFFSHTHNFYPGEQNQTDK